MNREEMLEAVRKRDKSFRGKFYVAVRTTKIVCTPDCPAKPLEKNIDFYDNIQNAFADGYRPCKICMKEYYPDNVTKTTNKMETIKITRYQSPVGEMILGSYMDKLCLCDWAVEKRRRTIDRRICRHLNAEYEAGTSDIINQTIAQLDEYFAGKRKEFSIPVVFTGSPFQCNVWAELMKIPYGSTISYAELATRINNPKAVRAVASANATNPISIFVPCHRVIGSNHKLTGYGGGLDAKQGLLALEARISGKILAL